MVIVSFQGDQPKLTGLKELFVQITEVNLQQIVQIHGI